VKKIISVVLAVVLLLSFNLTAFARASNQLSSYTISITPLGNGQIRVALSVFGTHNQMSIVGFPSVAVYERNNSSSSWGMKHSSGPHYNPNTSAGSHVYAFIYQGVAGRQYYAASSFLAKDAQGSDSRSANSPWVTAS
jgi:hypothetical protein